MIRLNRRPSTASGAAGAASGRSWRQLEL